MTDSTTPVVTPEDQLPEEVRSLTRDQRLSKARNAAQSTILKKNRKEFDQEMVKEAAALGVEWAPRAKTAAEKGLEQIEALLEKFPELREEVAEAILAQTVPEPAKPHLAAVPAEPEPAAPEPAAPEPAEETSKPAQAWVAGALRNGRVTLDGATFVYVVADDTRRVPVDGVNVKLLGD